MSGNIFFTECYKIFFRRTNLLVLSAAIFAAFFMGMGRSVWSEVVIHQGQEYHKKEAIDLNKEIAAEFTGILTEETARAIVEKYGEPVFFLKYQLRWSNLEAAVASGGSDNYCSRFIYWMFGESGMGEDGEITYTLQENLADNPYLQGDYFFGYAGDGWTRYWDHFMFPYMLVCIIIVIALAPIFSEDYSLGISDIVLPTAKGRFTLWRTRIAAAGFFTSIAYWLVCGTTFLQMLFFYGSDGLNVSCRFAEMPIFWTDDAAPAGKAILQMYLCGWFAVLVLAALVCALSAKCRQPFLSLISSALVCAAPFAIDRLLLDALMQNLFIQYLHVICYSSTIYYPFMFLQAPDSRRLLITGIAAAAALAGTVGGVISYCRHQT